MRKLYARIVLWLITPALDQRDSNRAAINQSRQVFDAVITRAMAREAADPTSQIAGRPDASNPARTRRSCIRPDGAPPTSSEAALADPLEEGPGVRK